MADLDSDIGLPRLSDVQFRRVIAYAVAERVPAGVVVFAPGDVDYGLIVVESGLMDILSPERHDASESIVEQYGPGDFSGELNSLTGQAAVVLARMREEGVIHRITREQFRRLMAAEPDLSDLFLRTFLARRDVMRNGPLARGIAILGSAMSAECLTLQTFAARQRLAHLWFDSDSAAGLALAESAQLTLADLPAVFTPQRILRHATPRELSEVLGLHYRRGGEDLVDLTVIGAGPAGLAAAVYGASEGLATVVLDTVGAGGQAAASTRIENYLGFPSGISGDELTQRAAVQAMKFGAELSSPCRVVDLDTSGQQLTVMLSNGTAIQSRAVLIATGVRYRGLDLDRWSDFEGVGIYYAATELETNLCGDHPVTVVGGANSAGQAALYLASRGNRVTVVARRLDLADTMSSYLLARLETNPRITIRTGTEVTGLSGGSWLERISLTDNTTGDILEQDCRGLFCFIGAQPATEWLRGINVDDSGFIRTDAQLDHDELGPTWAALGRAPLPFETSMPCVFAAGDVRLDSVKRVAAAVGEGSSVVRSIHAAIGMTV
jgi:thioredoxin reductase (NADPH)